MKLTLAREVLLGPLQNICGVVERRQTMPILSNLLCVADEDGLVLTATDLEVELVATIRTPVDTAGKTTIPARKLFDICKSLPEDSDLNLALDGDKLTVRSGRSRFSLACLPADDFPALSDFPGASTVKLPQTVLRKLIERTHFSMAQQDVRYYLNGLLLEIGNKVVRCVATDGHRLSMASIETESADGEFKQVIIPRKGVLELLRLLDGGEEAIELSLTGNHVRLQLGNVRFTSKLIDGRFPDYQRVIPSGDSNSVLGSVAEMKSALQRASILSNEKYRGVRLGLRESTMIIQAHNPDQEEAEVELGVEYEGPEIEIGFNASYLIDALAALETEQFSMSVTDSSSSCVLRNTEGDDTLYVVMPMRL